MNKKINWKLVLAIILIIISLSVYTINFLIFRDSRNIFFYFFMDLAFLPLNVLFVTLLLDSLLNQRERKSKLYKLNMVIGAFFSEVGITLLARHRKFDSKSGDIAYELNKISSWKKNDYIAFKNNITKYESRLNLTCDNEVEIKLFLLEKRDFLLRLLENPNLLEHETFTELLWAVFHITEELSCRNSFDNQPESDLNHIKGDFKRAYNLLIKEWISYLEHLKISYPYLYSLALRQNPFNEEANVIIY
ncbi:MAG: hypothetical protein PHU65_03220 [Actinomycetota bacterium]|nr:hypothetical protein [Actinomycetota bacterium]